MSSWYRGYMKVKGSYDDINRFLNDVINMKVYNNHKLSHEVDKGVSLYSDDGYVAISYGYDSGTFNNVYVLKGVENKVLFSFTNSDVVKSSDSEYIAVFGMEWAWGLNVPYLIKLSKKYNLYFKGNFYNSDSCSVGYIDVCRGKDRSTSKKYESYSEYLWDCDGYGVGD